MRFVERLFTLVVKQSRPARFGLVLGLLCLLPGAAAYGQTSPDVRLVVDISGSMKQNDPNNLRQPAVELLTQLLPPGSKAGVWTFGQYVNMLVPHRPVDSDWASDAASKAGQINSVGLFTNIGAALEKATYDSNRADDQYKTSIILLTDGMVDIDKDPAVNQREWRRIVDEVVPKLAAAGIRVHTIALSDKADSQLLNKLALATGGKAAKAKTADELMKAFLAAFDQAAPAEQVPLEGNAFSVDSSVEEFTALIFRESKVTPTVLVGPDQAQYTQATSDGDPDVSWHSGLDYDLITLKRPLEGEWVVTTGIAPDSRVTVVSNLNLVVKPLPANLYRGQTLPLDIRLQEDGSTVTAQDFLELVTLSVITEQQDERWVDNLSNAGIPADGVYRKRLARFNALGEFKVTISLDGKSFQRQVQHSVNVRDAFSVELRPGAQPGMPYELHVVPYTQSIDLQQSSVIARIKTPSGQTSIIPLPLTQVDDWLLKYSPKEEGQYEFSLSIDVLEQSGNGYQYEHPTITLNYPEGSASPAKPAPVEQPAPAEPEPIAEPEPEPEDTGTPWWIYVALGVGNLLILVLAFVAYKIIMGVKKADAEEVAEPPKKKEKAKKKSKKEAKAEPEPEPEDEDEDEEPAAPEKPAAETLAMADISDDDLDDDAFASDDLEATDLSSDAALDTDIDMGSDMDMDDGSAEVPEAPIDDLDAMLAEATANMPDSDTDDDAEFTLDDFDDDKKK